MELEEMKSKSVGIFFSLSSYHVGSVPFFIFYSKHCYHVGSIPFCTTVSVTTIFFFFKFLIHMSNLARHQDGMLAFC